MAAGATIKEELIVTAAKVGVTDRMSSIASAFRRYHQNFAHTMGVDNLKLSKGEQTVPADVALLVALLPGIATAICEFRRTEKEFQKAAAGKEAEASQKYFTDQVAILLKIKVATAKVEEFDTLVGDKGVAKNIEQAILKIWGTMSSGITAGVSELSKAGLGEVLAAAAVGPVVEFGKKCSQDETVSKEALLPMAGTPEAVQLFVAFRAFDKVKMVMDEVSKVITDFPAFAASTAYNEASQILASLTCVQALYRPLAPHETRAGLLAKALNGIKNGKVSKPHDAVYRAMIQLQSK